MKLATIRVAGGTRAVKAEEAVLTKETVLIDLGATDVGEFLSAPGWQHRAAAVSGADPGAVTYPAAAADFAPLVPNPSKILCVGLNYRNHIREMGHDMPDYPTLFAKFPDSLLGANDDLVKPAETDQWDWEAELAIVIGKPARRVKGDAAAAAIAGFTVLNDVSARDWQRRTSEFLQGKMWDRSTPVGPYLVTPDELPGGTSPELKIELTVDRETMQDDSTANLVFGPVALVEYISTIIRLNPGDIIATGTPGGVGSARKPPRFLVGDELVTARIAGIGETANRVVKEKA